MCAAGLAGCSASRCRTSAAPCSRTKVGHINGCPADTIVDGDVSCLTHMNGGLSRQESSKRVQHIADVLAERTAIMKNTTNSSPTPSAPRSDIAIATELPPSSPPPTAHRRTKRHHVDRRLGTITARRCASKPPKPSGARCAICPICWTRPKPTAGQRVRGAVGEDAQEARQHVLDIARQHKSRTSSRVRAWSARRSSSTPRWKPRATRAGNRPGRVHRPTGGRNAQPHRRPGHPQIQRDIRDLFMDKLDMPPTDDAAEMTNFARRYFARGSCRRTWVSRAATSSSPKRGRCAW